MSQEKSINEIFESLTNGLVHIAKYGTKEEVNQAIQIMEEGWAKIDEFDYNKELIKLWKESHKEKKATNH